MYIYYLLFLIVLYIYMYNPPISFIGGTVLPYVLVFVSLVCNIYNNQKWLGYIRFFKIEYFLFIVVLLYSFLRSGIVGDYSYIVRHLLTVLYFVSVIPFLLVFANKVGIKSVPQLLTALLIISSFAGCVSVLAIIVPEIDEYIRGVIIQYQEDDYLYGKITRGYGLASGLTSSYGYIQGVMAALGFLYYKSNKWFLFFMPIVFFSALINARTGVLITIFGILVFMFSKNLKALVPVLIVTTIFVFYFENIMRMLNINDFTVAWILDFQDKMVEEMYSGDIHNGYISNLFHRMVVWPSDFEWIVGRGINLYDIKTKIGHSDMGWFIQLNYGGLLYVALLFSIFITIAKRLLKLNSAFAIFFIGVVLVVNTKSIFFPSISFFPSLMLVYVVYILNYPSIKRPVP